jgi:hypothetical protein
MFKEMGDFTVSEGYRYPLVEYNRPKDGITINIKIIL